ncbi:MAG: glycosyltransferase family protein [Methylocystis sp.]|uniref:glycosyltransferase family protein n=1 Tax=Methylocystis sp. TaxID=1911079 RepID=UPI003DA5F20F
MKLLYFGPLYPGSTTAQRLEAFAALPGVEAVGCDTCARPTKKNGLYHRVRWRMRWPIDSLGENRSLVEAVAAERPDIVFVDSCRVLTRRTLNELRRSGAGSLVFYSPDDIMGAHNLSWQLRSSFPDWDVFFTTKTFNIAELAGAKVRLPYAIGKSYDPKLHRPLSRQEVGPEFERFDCVFVGAYEAERCTSINRLAEAGHSVVVYGGVVAGWSGSKLHPSVTLRDLAFNEEYTRALHHGKIALCFLRKLNRDRITQRTMEITACARPMVGEKTDEHDQHFKDGLEYLGFTDDKDLLNKTAALIADPKTRSALGAAGRERCLVSAYSSLDRAKEMLNVMIKAGHS